MAIDTTSLRTRRALLRGVLGGAAALAAQSLGRPTAVQAHDPDDLRLGSSNQTSQETSIYNLYEGATAFRGHGTGFGTGLLGNSDKGDAITGESGSGEGVHGYSASGNGIRGESSGPGATSIYGLKGSAGAAVKGENTLLTNGYAAVYGLTNGTGPGTFGENTQDGNGASGVARGTGSGVYGQSDLGRGGLFYGPKAQVRLQPTAATSHPTSGQAGDLYVDHAHRLWFCKGGTTWKQLA